MKRKFFTLLNVLLIALLVVTPAGAGGGVRYTGSAPTSGSPLYIDGYLTGLGGYKAGVTLKLIGFGIPETLCTNQGGNEAPGQNPPKVSTSGEVIVKPEDIQKNGRSPDLHVVTEDLVGTILPGTQGGCPNDNWTAKILSIAWTDAIILVTNNANGNELLRLTYTCTLRAGTTSKYDCTLAS